ncbi:MAG TPA: primosomal protein N', partial [Thermodesulfovibrionales bacterium]|nr:primosomal protein N' [Thermodesulfovibrionales bacterium]
GVIRGKAMHIPQGSVKEIHTVLQDRPIFTASMMNLIQWMADYYLVSEGLVLKSMLPKDLFKTAKSREPVSTRIPCAASDAAGLATDHNITATMQESISRMEYKTYLLHVPSFLHEISYLSLIARNARSSIVLVPEVSHIEEVAPYLYELAGQRLTILHGRLSSAQRRNAFHRIISGDSDVVLGTRLAVFSPLRSPSFIAVLQEHDRSYKNLEGLRYHARDTAVMRGYLEKATVLLSSPCPSLESFHNSAIGKYTPLTPGGKRQKPRIEVINMKVAKKITSHLSKRTMDVTASCIKNKGNALLLVNRKGYSMLQCADCGSIEACQECSIPLVYHKNEGLLKCHYCGYARKVTDICSKCKSSRFEMVGAGTQRIASDIEHYLHVKPLLLDKDVLREYPDHGNLHHISPGKETVVGTKVITKRLPKHGSFDLCVLLNPDMQLHLPDFRSAELLFQEIVSTSEYVRDAGLLLIQTRMPEHYLFRHIKTYNLSEFYKEELSVRRSLSYPPFSRMVLFTITAKGETEEILMRALTYTEGAVEVIGPVRTHRKRDQWKLLLKSPSKKYLHRYARNILEKLGKKKGLRTVADVDPIAV